MTTDALRLHVEFPIEQLHRAARVSRIWEGRSQIQRMIISRRLPKD